MSTVLDALERGRALAQQGAIDSAIPLLRQAAEDGLGEACIELLRIERERGNESDALSWLKVAESIAHTGDANANLSCYLAYQMLFGEGSLEQQQAKGNEFLRRAAELGSAIAQTMLAQQLLWGLNGQTKSEVEYEGWIAKAIEQNLDDAIITHVRNMLRLERGVEARVKSKLERLALRSEQARKLLDQLQ